MYEDDTSFTNCSTVNNNLDYFIKKYKKTRVVSPVIIQSYGNNNFAIELINEIRNNNNYQFGNEFDDLRCKRKYKANTNITDISPDNNNTFYNTKGSERFVKYKNYTNINDNINKIIYNNISYISVDKCSPKNKTIIDDKTYNYLNHKLFKKEEDKDLLYPNKKPIFSHKKIKTDLQFQRYSSSFIPKANKLKKKIVKKCNIIKQVKLRNENKTPSIAKSKNQLEEFNIDKLKEIGDHLAIKLINRINQKKINKNIVNNRNNINIKSITEDKDKDKQKENEFINNMMKIDQKRKNSKNKTNLINKVKNSSKNNDLVNSRNNKRNQIRIMNENYFVNSPPNKLVRKYNKDKELLNGNTQRYIKKIKFDDKFMRNAFKLKPFKSFNPILKTSNINMNNTCKSNYRKNINYQINYYMNDTNINDISNKENQSTFYNDNINFNNQKINFYNNNEYIDLRRKSNNYSYLGTVNFKNNKKINKYSFNNIFLP